MKMTKKLMDKKHLDFEKTLVYEDQTDRYSLKVVCARCRDVLGHCDDVTMVLHGDLAEHSLEDCVDSLGKVVRGLTDRLMHHRLL